MICVLLTSLPTPVLIETYWNVKDGSATKLDGYQVCINRNILECKDIQHDQEEHRKNCINRNILECKGKCGKNGCSCS